MGEHQERGCIGDYAAVQSHARGDSGHCMLANPEVDVSAIITPACTHRTLDLSLQISGFESPRIPLSR